MIGTNIGGNITARHFTTRLADRDSNRSLFCDRGSKIFRTRTQYAKYDKNARYAINKSDGEHADDERFFAQFLKSSPPMGCKEFGKPSQFKLIASSFECFISLTGKAFQDHPFKEWR
jgi:uncharacterized C2H2 Zn-finger protein